MDSGKLQELVRLVLRRFSVEVTGPWNARESRVESYEFTPDFKDFWLTLSPGVVEPRGVEPLTSSMPLRRSPS